MQKNELHNAIDTDLSAAIPSIFKQLKEIAGKKENEALTNFLNAAEEFESKVDILI